MQRIIGSVDSNRPASYAEIRLRLDAVVFGINRKRPVAHVHEALFGIGRFARFHAIGTRRNRNVPRADFHGIFAVEAILDSAHPNRAAIDNQVVFREYPMAIIARNIERA